MLCALQAVKSSVAAMKMDSFAEKRCIYFTLSIKTIGRIFNVPVSKNLTLAILVKSWL